MPGCSRREFLEMVSTGAAVAALAAPSQLHAERKPKERGISRSILKRINGRTFPSVFQAWNRADNLRGEDELTTVARHDLLFHGVGFFGLRWDHRYAGLARKFRKETIPLALARRKKLLDKNPNMIVLAEIRYRDASARWFPPGHKWWRRGKDQKVMPGWSEGGHLQMDFSDATYRGHVAVRAAAAVTTGVVDGVMLDWWRDDDDRLELVKLVRSAIGPEALILVNPNDRTTPGTAEFINGYFMECCVSRTPEQWTKIARTLAWAEKNLRKPRINCLETWYHASRRDLPLMRATTALALTHSDGYCLFSDPNPLPTPDHRHDWYPFWEKGLGRPTGPARARPDGVVLRPFSEGWAAYNPMGGREATVSFPEPVTSRATGRRSRTHRLAAPDGDLFLRTPGKFTRHSPTGEGGPGG